LSDLKWLWLDLTYRICEEDEGESEEESEEESDEDSEEVTGILTDAVFVKLFSQMQLEYFDFDVYNARVTTRLYSEHSLRFIVLQRYSYYNSSCNCVLLFHCCTCS
jgi:hypothetical protein